MVEYNKVLSHATCKTIQSHPLTQATQFKVSTSAVYQVFYISIGIGITNNAISIPPPPQP